MSSENKTEKATPRRRQKSREKGQIARSRELPSALVVMAVIFFLLWRLPVWGQEWGRLFAELLATASSAEIAPGTLIVQNVFQTVLIWMVPVFILTWTLATATMFAQGGIVFAPSALELKWDRLNPVSELQRFFSVEGLNRLLKSVVPMGGLLLVFYSVLSREWSRLLDTSSLGFASAFGWMWDRAYELAWKGALWLIAWAVIDYVLQRVRMERGMRMSHQDLRDEAKDTQQSPMIKQKIRQLQRERRRRRMLEDVPYATVVVTNPTHYAVALRYQPESMAAPTVVAKGRDHLAQNIKRIARWNEVPIVENPPLARALYQAVDIGGNIPEALYATVAEMLAFLYRTQRRLDDRVAAHAHQAPTS